MCEDLHNSSPTVDKGYPMSKDAVSIIIPIILWSSNENSICSSVPCASAILVPNHQNLLHLTTVTILHEEYNLQNSASWIVNPAFLFLNTLKIFTSLRMGD